MVLKYDIQVSGTDELRETWRRLGEKYSTEVMQPAIRNAAVIMLRGIRADLAKKVTFRSGTLNNGFILRTHTPTQRKVGISIVNKVFYGRFQDQGWKQGKRHSRGGTGERRQIPGKFYMFYGARNVKEQADDEMLRVVNERQAALVQQ